MIMPSRTSSGNSCPLGFQLSRTKRSAFSTLLSFRPPILLDSSFCSRGVNYSFDPKCLKIGVGKYGCCSRRRMVQVMAMGDEDSVSSYPFDDWVDNEESVEYDYSSDGEQIDDGEMMLNPISDLDLPSVSQKYHQNDDALTVTAYRLAMMGKARRKSRRIRYGSFMNIGLMTFLILLLLLVDWCAWRIVRLPLSPCHLMRPFFTSAILASCAGYIGVPLLRRLKLQSIIKQEVPARHSIKKGTPTMGGLFFIPVGVIVAQFIVGFSSIEVSGAALVTLFFAAIGLVDDSLSLINNNKDGLSAWMRILLEVAVGVWFCFWLVTTNISSPYSMYIYTLLSTYDQQFSGGNSHYLLPCDRHSEFIKMVVPLPGPVGLVCLGKSYLILTSFCFVSMGNGINLTDGLDGLAGGTAALAFIGMSIAVLPICSDLAVFGASMAGACVGFLTHNRYKASIFMGDTGSLALGGALAAMAACTGMFFPLFISSGIFFLEALSVIMQVSYFKTMKYIGGRGQRLFRMAPFHHHLELCGVKEPVIVGGAYIISSILMLCAGYIGLVSA